MVLAIQYSPVGPTSQYLLKTGQIFKDQVLAPSPREAALRPGATRTWTSDGEVTSQERCVPGRKDARASTSWIAATDSRNLVTAAGEN